MGLFRRKKDSEKVSEDRQLVSTNEKTVDSLIILAKGNDEFVQQLKLLQEKLKYLTPTETAKDYDKKIKNQIEDLRIVLVKADGQELPKKAENILTQIQVLISDRNANI